MKPSPATLTQASKWFLRMKDAAPDHAERGKFEAWLMSSECHRQAYQTIAETWEDFDSSEHVRQISQAMLTRKLDQDMRKRQQSSKLAKLGSLLAVCVGLGLAWQSWQHWQAQPLETLVQLSQTGQLVTHTLSDGSTLTLDAKSNIEVSYFRDRRTVKLLQGQAVFEVVKDADRPFVVESAQARITVKGTRFVVNHLQHKTLVGVDHGRVLVESLHGDRHQTLLLTDGQVAEVGDQSAPRKRTTHAADMFAFLQGKLIFDGARMDEVSETLSRYRQLPLINDSHTSAEISAVVDIKQMSQFIQKLPMVAPVRLKQAPAHTVIMDR